jgi:hypothetical protein
VPRYIHKEKFASFKMKGDENMSEMFYRLQVLVNDLKALGEEVKDPQVLEMLTIKIWHIGHYSSDEWFGHHDTKPSVGRYNNR